MALSCTLRLVILFGLHAVPEHRGVQVYTDMQVSKSPPGRSLTQDSVNIFRPAVAVMPAPGMLVTAPTVMSAAPMTVVRPPVMMAAAVPSPAMAPAVAPPQAMFAAAPAPGAQSGTSAADPGLPSACSRRSGRSSACLRLPSPIAYGVDVALCLNSLAVARKLSLEVCYFRLSLYEDMI